MSIRRFPTSPGAAPGPRFAGKPKGIFRADDDTQQCERLNFQHTKAVWQASCHTAFSTSSYGSFDLSLLRLGMISPPG